MANIKFLQTSFICDFIAGDAQKVGKFKFPQLRQTNYVPDAEVLPFNYLHSTNPRDFWYHCFVDDAQFSRIYRNPWKYIGWIKKTRGFIGTDFSMYRNDDEDNLIENCRINRSIGYALQKENVPFIPTAGFAGESTWEWCFDGLPTNSTVAVTTNCLNRDPEAHRLFVGGINALIEQISPTTIVVCGRCPDWLNKKYPMIKIVPILSYSQRWYLRRKEVA